MARVRVYESPYAAPFFPQMSIFQYLFPDGPGISPLPEFDPSLPAFIDGKTGRTLSRAELKDTALRLAGMMRAPTPDGMGLARGDVACIWGFNSLEWVVAAYACMAAGVTLSPANAAYAPGELAHQINDSDASLVFVAPSHVAAFDETRPLLSRDFPPSRVVLLCTLEDKPPALTQYRCLWEVLAAEPAQSEPFDRVDSHNTAWLCYSSGTTGLPKGVMTTHFNVTSQVQAGNIGFQRMKPQRDVVLVFIPSSHIYGAVIGLLQPISQGAAVVILPRFEEVPVLAAIERVGTGHVVADAQFKVTLALLVPPVFIVLLNSPNVKRYNLTSLRTVMSGAAPLSEELLQAFSTLIPSAVVIQAYGMTETSPNICNMHRGNAKGHGDAVGRLLPGFQARLVKDDGEDADTERGEAGELWVRGPCVMRGYHNNRAATEATIAPGGWMQTGDIVERDREGWIKVVDRKKELIKYKGFQVAPAELEGLLIQHPSVRDAGVIGVYDPAQATEVVRAYVVFDNSEDQHASLAANVSRWVAARAARAKHLSGGIVVVDQVPKSPSGKILRKLLRERAKRDEDVVHGVQAKL